MAGPPQPHPEEPGPPDLIPPVVPYPYADHYEIGGDSVLAITHRLLMDRAPETPPRDEAAFHRFVDRTSFEYKQALNEARDILEVKVDIIQLMAALDQRGDWLGRGASALQSARTRTGEESLDKLYAWRDDLQSHGGHSAAFRELSLRVFSRMEDPDEHSSAGE